MTTEQEKLRELLRKRMNDSLSSSEETELDDLLSDYDEEELTEIMEGVFAEADINDIDPSYYEHDWEAIRKKIVATPQPAKQTPSSRFLSFSFIRSRLKYGTSYAAAIVAIITVIAVIVNLLINRSPSNPVTRHRYLIKQLQESTACGLVEPSAKDSRMIHIKIQGSMQTVSISPGWQFHTELPDGTEVTLNTASSVTYPRSFEGHDKREVSIQGEVFFDVAKNKRQPFIVKAGDIEILALGTSFNVNAYGDKDSVYTTLVEGSLRVMRTSTPSSNTSPRHFDRSEAEGEISLNANRFNFKRFTYRVGRANLANARNDGSGVILAPGQQAAIALKDTSSIKINKANLAVTGMWKEGYFNFNESRIEEVMKELSRWYNWEISYDSIVTPVSFSGTFCRRTSEAEVLQVLKDKGIRFQKTGNKLLIQ